VDREARTLRGPREAPADAAAAPVPHHLLLDQVLHGSLPACAGRGEGLAGLALDTLVGPYLIPLPLYGSGGLTDLNLRGKLPDLLQVAPADD